jgi:hypothetical protein
MLLRGCEVLFALNNFKFSEIIIFIGCDENRNSYRVAPSLRLNRRIRLRVKLVLNCLFVWGAKNRTPYGVAPEP